jgi:hypothetical protein
VFCFTETGSCCVAPTLCLTVHSIFNNLFVIGKETDNLVKVRPIHIDSIFEKKYYEIKYIFLVIDFKRMGGRKVQGCFSAE